MMGGSAATTCKLEYNINITTMKQILSLWDACPQGGKHRRSVFLRLLLFVCMLVTAQAGWADTYTVANESSFNNVNTNADGITISGTKANQNFTSSGKKDCFNLNSASSVWIYSQLTNITGISFDIVRNTNGNTKSSAVTMTIASGGAFSTPTSGFSATNDGSSMASLSGITAVGNNQSSATAISVTFDNAVKSIVLTQTTSCSVRNITVTYDKGTLPSTYFAAHISGENAGTIDTNPGGASTTIATNGTTTVGSDTYYKLNSNGISINLGSGNTFAVGDQIMFDIAGSGTNKTNKETYIKTGSGTNVVSLSTGALTNAFAFKHFYVVQENDGIAGTQSAKIISGATDCRYYSYAVLRESSGPTAPTSSVADNSSLEKNTANAITLTSSGNTVYYKWSQTNNEYAANAGSTLADAADGNDSSPINVNTPSTTGTWYLYAVAKNGSDEYSDVAKYTYTITNPTAATPTFSPASGSVEEGSNITITSSDGGTVYYKWDSNSDLTTTGTTGTTVSTTGLSAGSHTLYAIVTGVTGKDDSAVGSATYTLTAPAVPLTPVSNYTWDFSTSPWTTKTYNKYTVENNIGLGNKTEIAASGSGNPQRLKLNGGSGKAATAEAYSVHFKVAANSKIKIVAVGGTNRTMVISKGSFNSASKEEVDLNDATIHANALTYWTEVFDSETDVYIYEKGTNGNITLESITVAPTYAITNNITGSGTVTTTIGDETVTRAAAGEEVTITATPATGAQLSSLTVTKTDGGASVDVTSSNTFTMPAEAVTVNATFGAGSAAAPTFQPGASTISTTQTITLTSATENANIYYTTDGSTPTSSSTKYTDPFTLGNSATVKAIAYDSSDANPSAVSSKTYTIDATAPTLSSTSPTNGSTGRGTSGTISLTFNEAVTIANAEGITITGGAVTIGSKAVDGENPNKVNISVSGLANSTEYTVTTASGAITDAVGNPYTGGSFSFTTGAAATTIVLEKTGEKGSTFDDGSNTSSIEFSSTTTTSGYRSPLSVATGTAYRTGSKGSITLTLNSTSASKIVIGAVSSSSSSERTLSSVKVNDTDVTNTTITGTANGNSSVSRITVDGLSVPQGGTVTFTFSGNVQFFYFEVTPGSGDVPPTFTTSPADNASGVAVNAAVTLTANKDISAVGGTIAGTLNGAACTFTLDNDGSGNPRVLTLDKTGDFANATQYTVVLSAGQVQDGNGTANLATDFTFTTVAAVVPTIAFNNPTTSMTVGGGTVTNAAATTNDGGATVTYTSSNTSVATVAAGGVVTAVAAGTTTITASMTVGSTEYTARYTMTVNAASVGSTKWDFTTLSSDEIAAMRGNVNGSTKTLKENSSDKYFSNTGSFSKFTNDSGDDLNVTDGLTFGKSGGSLSAADIRYFYGDGDKRIFIKSSNEYIQLPSQAAETEITVSWRADGGSRTLTPSSNASIKEGSSATIATSGNSGTSTFTVNSAGVVQFKVNGNVSLFSITISSGVEVAAPTITPASGTHEGETNKSVTVTTNATNTPGTLTTYYVVGTSAVTNAATVAAGTEVTSGSATSVDLSSYETDVVISAVTKYVDGSSNTFFSPITTATYTYAGKATPKVQGSNMILHHGDFADIVNSITMTDKAGNPLLFGNEEIPNYSDYFTFEYEIDSESASQATSTNVTLSEGRLTCAEGSAVTTGNGIKINITATPKAAAEAYVKTGTVYGSLYVQVTPKESSGYEYVGLYWDKDFSAASELKEGVDYEVQQISGVNYFVLNNVPNSRRHRRPVLLLQAERYRSHHVTEPRGREERRPV